jgi:hypothetical protein
LKDIKECKLPSYNKRADDSKYVITFKVVKVTSPSYMDYEIWATDLEYPGHQDYLMARHWNESYKTKWNLEEWVFENFNEWAPVAQHVLKCIEIVNGFFKSEN